jgi:hypothetical protein
LLCKRAIRQVLPTYYVGLGINDLRKVVLFLTVEKLRKRGSDEKSSNVADFLAGLVRTLSREKSSLFEGNFLYFIHVLMCVEAEKVKQT